MPKIEPGALCVIIHATFLENLGTFVEVLSFEPDEPVPSWLVQPSRPIRVCEQADFWFGPTVIPARSLLPIAPPYTKDSTNAETEKRITA